MEQLTVLGKDLSDKNEDNNYEPFTFELKPDLHYKPSKAEHRSSSSNSSSTDSDDDDDFIQLDTNSLASRPPNNDPNAISHKNPNSDQLLFRPTIQPGFSATPVGTTNGPGMQVSDDLSRIPTSVFTTQSKVPMEWSVTSAESLFSLNFSNSSSLPPASPTATTTGLANPAVSDFNLEGFGGPLEVLEEKGEGANDDVVKEDVMELRTDGGRLDDVTVANSQRSDGTISSVQSFAFPVLAVAEKNESIRIVRQLHPSPPPAATAQSVLAKTEPEHELASSSNSNHLTQPPQTQVMAAPDKEASTVAVTTAPTNDNVSTHDATKTTSTTGMSSGPCCSCCC